MDATNPPVLLKGATLSLDSGSAGSLESDDTVAADTRPREPKASTLQPGGSIDRFIVEDTLGQGGMGLVVRAHDALLDRKVAIKVLRPTRSAADDQSSGRTRLLREAQAMARVSHPNVITVHEFGYLGERVFIAMEWVDGGTLGAWQRGKSWREILATYLLAGRGLAAAHASGLVHRDFKPDNVLVGTDGRVRVTDFGLVSSSGADGALEASSAELALPSDLLGVSLTRTGSILGTPRYMSPEQHGGRNLDARSDQFSFCVALYEALYGELPYEGRTYAELSTHVCEGVVREPPRSHSVPRWVRGVLLRGMRVDPDRRFASMELLLHALTPTDAIAWRRWAVYGAAGVAAIALTAAATRPDEARAAAVPCARAAAPVHAVWNDTARFSIDAAFRATKRGNAAETSRRVVAALDDYAGDIAAARIEACKATMVRGEQSEQMLTRRNECLDERLTSLRGLVTAYRSTPTGDMVDNATGAALGLPAVASCGDDDALAATESMPDDPALAARVRAARIVLAEAAGLMRAGQYHKGRLRAEDAVGEVADIGFAPLLAEALLLRGNLQGLDGDFAAAEATLKAAIRAGAEARDDRSVALAWARLLHFVGYEQRRYDDAMALVPAAEAAVLRNGTDPEVRAHFLLSLGTLYQTHSHFDEARSRYEEALALREQLYGPDHPETTHVLVRLGAIPFERGDFAAARVYFERTLAIRRKAFGDHHVLVAASLANIASTYIQQEMYAEAQSHAAQALEIRRATLGERHPDVASSYEDLGIIAARLGERDKAVDLYLRSIDIRSEVFGPDHPITGKVRTVLGLMYSRMGKLEEARVQMQRGLTAMESAGVDVRLGVTYINLGAVSYSSGDYEGAFAAYAKGRDVIAATAGPDSAYIAFALTGLGQAATMLERDADAIKAFERAIEVQRAAGVAPIAVAETTASLARVYFYSGDTAKATQLSRQARDVFRAAGQAGASKLAEIVAFCAKVGIKL